LRIWNLPIYDLFSYLYEGASEMALKRGWTAEDIAKLREMAGKQPVSSIAIALDRGMSATSVKAHQLGISLRRVRPGDQPDNGVARPSPDGADNAPA
jgi:hypothetical protein